MARYRILPQEYRLMYSQRPQLAHKVHRQSHNRLGFSDYPVDGADADAQLLRDLAFTSAVSLCRYYNLSYTAPQRPILRFPSIASRLS